MMALFLFGLSMLPSREQIFSDSFLPKALFDVSMLPAGALYGIIKITTSPLLGDDRLHHKLAPARARASYEC